MQQEVLTGSLTPKKWKDLTSDEKIETLRSEAYNVRYLSARVSELERQINKLKIHQHGTDGQCLVPIEERYDGEHSIGQSFDRLT